MQDKEKPLFGRPASETIRMFYQVLLAAFLAFLSASVQSTQAEIHKHSTDISNIQATQAEVIVRLDGDIQEIRESLRRIEAELSALRQGE